MDIRTPLIAAVLFSGCADPTEVVVFVDTTLAVPCLVDRIEVAVTGDGPPEVRTASASAGQSSLTILRDGSGSTFDVVATGYLGNHAVASARATVAFTDARRLSIPMVLDETCLNTECDFSDRVQDFTQPAPADRASCEGLSLNYSGAPTRLETFVDACNVAVAGFERLPAFTNDELQPTNAAIVAGLADGFEFSFYGERIRTLWVSDDGYVAFSPNKPVANASQGALESIIAPDLLKYGVAAFWDDLSAANGEICLALLDGGGFDRLWITWKNMCFAEACSPADALTFSIGLEENSNRIVIAYDRMESGALPEAARGNGAVMGIRGFNQPTCGIDECSNQGLCTDGVTPCGFTQGFARTPQPLEDWPNRWLFQPVN